MLRLVIIIVLAFEISSSFNISDDANFDSHYNELRWSYDDEANWPGEKCKEGGKRQSPIDIKVSNVVEDVDMEFIKHGPLLFSGYQHVLVTGVNNGYTIQFSSDGDASMHPTLTGGPLASMYRLEQVHFHWLSEHSFEGVKFPMEIHFVHVRSDLPVNEALKKKDGLAIISVFCNVKAELDKHQLEATEEVMQQIPNLMKTGDRVSGIILDITKLLTPGTAYYTYAGSLTSPQCNEAVIWILFPTPILMKDSHYHLFGKIRTGGHNFRSVQKINRHQVYQSPYTTVQTPAVAIFFEKMVRIVADFFRSVTNFIVKGFKR